ncbi:hypothetical protein V494_01862 [Pseudogymnoascus sp. VKM F-4513 (FW-928)]|nr:hypothetical protein V494_01862 [Pseudogymnoascus sp. VKM F-4513 (FW-928)]
MPSSLISIESSDTTLSEPPAEPPTKKEKLTTSDFEIESIVIFIVGKEKHMLQIPQRTVCENSDLIGGELKDHSGKVVLIKQLPDVSVDIFTMFLVWISAGDINNAEDFAPPRSSQKALDLEDTSETLGQLIKCYQLAEILISRQFKNYVADQICDYLERLVDKDGLLQKTITRNVPLIYANSTEGSKLKCLLEDAVALHITDLKRWSIIEAHEASAFWNGVAIAAFWNGVAIAAIRKTRELEDGRMKFPLNWGEENWCKYHEHQNEDEVVDCRERRLEKAA